MAGIDAQWQADQADLHGIARQNGKIRYLLIVIIDILSKFGPAIPVYFNTAKVITAAFGQVLIDANPYHRRRLQTDKSNKFCSADLKTLMERHWIQHFASESVQKAAVVQRLH